MLCVGLLCLLAAGCSKPGTTVVTSDGSKVTSDGATTTIETTNEKGEKVKAEMTSKEGDVTIKDANGNTSYVGSSASDAELDLPKYPGATRMEETSMVMSTATGRTMAFTYKTADPFDKVLEFYKAQLSDIKPTLFSSGDDQTAFFAIKKDKRDGLISLTRKESEKETLIAISVTDKK